MPDEPVAHPEVEGEPEGPVQQPAQAGVEDALEEDVDRLPRSGEARFQRHEPGLHEEDQEGGDEDPHRVERIDDVVRLMRDITEGSRPGVGDEVPTEALHQAQHRQDAEHLPCEEHRP